MEKITLFELLNLQELEKVKLRFDTAWTPTENPYKFTTNPNNQVDILGMYARGGEERRKVEDLLVNLQKNPTEGSQKSPRRRVKVEENVFNFIKLRDKNWLLIKAQKIIDDKPPLAKGEVLKKYAPYFGRLIITFDGKGRSIVITDKEIIKNIAVKEILPEKF